MSSDARTDLGTYLKDHYAGAVGAMELLEHWCEVARNQPLGAFFNSLLEDVQSDHKTLHQIMSALQTEESSIRNAGAWLGEKFGRAKLGFYGGEGLVLLQALETLHIGITGKRLLWRALAASCGAETVLHPFDFGNLEKRALEQLDRVEQKRLETARSTFRSDRDS